MAKWMLLPLVENGRWLMLPCNSRLNLHEYLKTAEEVKEAATYMAGMLFSTSCPNARCAEPIKTERAPNPDCRCKFEEQASFKFDRKDLDGCVLVTVTAKSPCGQALQEKCSLDCRQVSQGWPLEFM